MPFLRMQDLDLNGKKVLVRVDYNVPLHEDGSIADDSRIRASLPTINYLLSQKAKIILISHLGRPDGKADPKASLAVCAKNLSEHLKKRILFCDSCTGNHAKNMASNLEEGDILLLENLRFHKEEEQPTPDDFFAKDLASLADFFVDDAFAASHRCHSSITCLPRYFQGHAAPGFLMEKEINVLSGIFEAPSKPFFAIIGGAKVSTKLKMLISLTKKADAFFIGGAMASTFLAAQGIDMADSKIEKELFPEALAFLSSCKAKNIEVFLPIDAIVLNSTTRNIEATSLQHSLSSNLQVMDIGPATVDLWTSRLITAKTIFWNGPLGKFEDSRFMQGTASIASALGALPRCTSIIGGGDTALAIHTLKLDSSFTHICTGGGAALEFIENQSLPGIDALKIL
jgi:phosphoglycerate kinase